MGVNYNRTSIKVTAALVNSVITTGGTVLSSGDVNGVFRVVYRVDSGGCGGPDSGIFVQLKDTYPWNGISFETKLGGSASCWSFNVAGSYGSIAGYNTSGYLQAYSTADGDLIYRSYLAQEDAQFSSHNPVTACDNDANNFMRYNTGILRYFTMKRRRDTSGTLAGPYIGRSCTSTGSDSLVIISNIFIWNR